MPEPVLSATIKANDAYSEYFQKFQQSLRQLAQEQKGVQAATISANEALANYINSKKVAAEAAAKLGAATAVSAKGYITEATSAKQVADAVAEYSRAQKDVTFTGKQLSDSLAAQGIEGKEAEAVMSRLDSTLDGVDGTTKRTTNSFYALALASAGLYALQRALRDVMGTGREFELTIKQAQAVTGDFSTALNDMAMASRSGALGIYGPTAMAQAYRELGQMGAETNEILAATPDIAEFATAALIDMDDSAYSVMTTAKSFNIALTDSGQIVDAYTEAMNRGALSGQDFSRVMGSAGAVAKMAGQDFREILSAASAMRDAGMTADEAGTSIKSALLALIDPSKEAKKALEYLGVEIYDASGQMKQWSDITAEFEKALAPFNEQSRQLALTTVFGSYGIRAMATSMNKGSEYLKEFTQQLKSADGATHKMADTMSDSLDGSIRKVNSSLERLKIGLFEDIKGGAGALLGVLDDLVTGFNEASPAVQRTIETLVGSAGLTVAVAALAFALKRTLIPALAEVGITTTALTGPLGIVIGLIGVLSAVGITAWGSMQKQKQALEENNKSVYSLAIKYDELQEKLAKTTAGTDEHKKLQDEEKTLMQQFARLMPDIVTLWNEQGEAIEFNNDKLRDNIRLSRQAIQDAASAQAVMSRQNYEFAQQELKQLLQGQERLGKMGVLGDLGFFGTPKPSEQYQAQIIEKQQEIDQLKALADQDYAAWQAILGNKPLSVAGSSTVGAYGKTLPDLSTSSKNAAKEAAKAYTEIIEDALYPYRAAVTSVSDALAFLTVKEQYLSQVIESGQGTVYQAAELDKVRAEQASELARQQDLLHKQVDAERVALAALTEQYNRATDPEAARELRKEMDSLTGSIAQAGQAWWQAEQQIFAAEKKHYDDAYQEAMDLMQHQVSMARMSTEQQIEYLEKLRAAHSWSVQQMRELEEDLYRLRKQQLSEYLDSLESEYKSKLDDIEARTESMTAAIQAQIDALESQGTASSRLEAERQHNKKLADLQEQRRYHELRTGTEHQKALKDLDEQIAEENRQWELQQQEWSRDDQKEHLQEQIDAVKDAGEEERRQLEEHYQKARKIAESGIMDTIASLAATEPKWLQTGKNLLAALIRGLESGDFGAVQSQIAQISQTAGAGVVTTPSIPPAASPSQATQHSQYYPYKTAINEIVWLKSVWDQGYKSGDQAAMNYAASEANKYYAQLTSQIAAMLRAMSYEQAYSWYKSEVYHEGGTVGPYGRIPLAADERLGILRLGETVYPANLVDAIRAIKLPAAGDGTKGGDTNIYFNGPLIGEANIDSDLDVKDVGDELRKEILALATTKGR